MCHPFLCLSICLSAYLSYLLICRSALTHPQSSSYTVPHATSSRPRGLRWGAGGRGVGEQNEICPLDCLFPVLQSRGAFIVNLLSVFAQVCSSTGTVQYNPSSAATNVSSRTPEIRNEHGALCIHCTYAYRCLYCTCTHDVGTLLTCMCVRPCVFMRPRPPARTSVVRGLRHKALAQASLPDGMKFCPFCCCCCCFGCRWRIGVCVLQLHSRNL